MSVHKHMNDFICLTLIQPEEKPREVIESPVVDTGGKKAKPQRRRRTSRVTTNTYSAQVGIKMKYFSFPVRKPTMWFQNRSYTDQAVQAQKMTKGRKF